MEYVFEEVGGGGRGGAYFPFLKLWPNSFTMAIWELPNEL